MPLVEAFGEAKAAALRALALDHESADAQVALGQVMFFAEWDWIAAERSFQRALAINPNHAEAYLYYGGLMEALGDLDRGFQLKWQGLESDSTSALAHVLIAFSFWNQRRYDDVIVWANKALDRDPRHLIARELLLGAYWMMGDFERALTEDLKRAEARSPNEETLAALKEVCADILHVYRRDGYAEAQRCMLKHRQRAGELLSDGAAQHERGDAGFWARVALRGGWRPRRGFRASSPRNRRARPCVGSSRRGASVGQLARGSAVQPVPHKDEIAVGLVTGPDDCGSGSRV